MDTALIVIILVAAALLMVAALWTAVRGEPSARRRPKGADHAPRHEAVLDITLDDTDSPAAQRLVDRTARQVFAEDQLVEEVVVKASDGTVIGTRRRPEPLPTLTPPAELPRRASRSGPSVISRPSHGLPPVGEAPEAPHRPIAERYDLPDEVLSHVDDPDDPTDIVRAVLVAAGRPVDALSDDVLRSGDAFLAVIGHRHGRPGQPSVLNDLYLRFRSSGAATGVVISLEHLSRSDVRRRELLAPELTHHGPDAIQLMADAFALGVDPLWFLTEPAAMSRQPS